MRVWAGPGMLVPIAIALALLGIFLLFLPILARPVPDVSGAFASASSVTVTVTVVNRATPQEFALFQNYPNPFNQGTLISYALPAECRVEIVIYNILGQKIITLVDQDQGPGVHSVNWVSRDDRGHAVASGVYFCVIQAGEFSVIKKMVVVR